MRTMCCGGGRCASPAQARDQLRLAAPPTRLQVRGEVCRQTRRLGSLSPDLIGCSGKRIPDLKLAGCPDPLSTESLFSRSGSLSAELGAGGCEPAGWCSGPEVTGRVLGPGVVGAEGTSGP